MEGDRTIGLQVSVAHFSGKHSDSCLTDLKLETSMADEEGFLRGYKMPNNVPTCVCDIKSFFESSEFGLMP